MRIILLVLFFLSMPTFAQEAAQYVCTIGGVYENVSGKVVQRQPDKAIGQQLYINADTGEVTGYFGTDGFSIAKIRRPKGLLTIETASGVLGDAANRLSVSPVDEGSTDYVFVYTKNWLIVSGTCSSVIRHN